MDNWHLIPTHNERLAVLEKLKYAYGCSPRNYKQIYKLKKMLKDIENKKRKLPRKKYLFHLLMVVTQNKTIVR